MIMLQIVFFSGLLLLAYNAEVHRLSTQFTQGVLVPTWRFITVITNHVSQKTEKTELHGVTDTSI